MTTSRPASSYETAKRLVENEIASGAPMIQVIAAALEARAADALGTRCPDPLAHQIADNTITDLAELIKAAVLLIEDLPPAVLWDCENLNDDERAAYDRLAAAVRKIS